MRERGRWKNGFYNVARLSGQASNTGYVYDDEWKRRSRRRKHEDDDKTGAAANKGDDEVADCHTTRSSRISFQNGCMVARKL